MTVCTWLELTIILALALRITKYNNFYRSIFSPCNTMPDTPLYPTLICNNISISIIHILYLTSHLANSSHVWYANRLLSSLLGTIIACDNNFSLFGYVSIIVILCRHHRINRNIVSSALGVIRKLLSV